MNGTEAMADLPFFITGPAESDVLFIVVTIFMAIAVVGFGALYFTIQAIPDRMAEGTSKTQLQIVGILGLLSLVTFNNAFWVAALLLAALRIPDVGAYLRGITAALDRAANGGSGRGDA